MAESELIFSFFSRFRNQQQSNYLDSLDRLMGLQLSEWAYKLNKSEVKLA